MIPFINSKNKQSPTILGAGSTLTGNISAGHNVQIHGTVNGDVTADTVIIGRGGIVNGKVKANILFLHGTMNGPADVGTANVLSSAKMSGILSYETLHITGNTGLDCQLKKKNK